MHYLTYNTRPNFSPLYNTRMTDHIQKTVGLGELQCIPLATEPGWLADRCSVSQQLGALETHTTGTLLFISHTTNVPLFKFRCNIFIGIRITKEMPGSAASGTHCRNSRVSNNIITCFYPDWQLVNRKHVTYRSTN
jgi:hypothetical protein